ncbi:conserved rodent malaria protein, unknown function [Plasmodium chabaudi chabaudi]|uniref:CRA domain-containing protein n=2 Tax=Plasmodium chabaudi TaxID=5825 RepID=A0A1D3L8Q9_PLACU|nr:conserved rodent malaria protein, unknown function [Plasmodium chabaudi chabaudi]SCL87883.1 conserved rodent malaria protein, unknown function [Plasmodium chabaudi chabaudi]SCL88828.1 conserved rodent malaria protein, unknown function [Plasmodium chabaudi adami]SCN63780.1 conserved rodent malaria protein, unknown function [Plasmodium chabaudi adami]VTZ71350.1 conserved rodent malaria protein, unknown function [Plasmodium chabaudi chabaudi]
MNTKLYSLFVFVYLIIVYCATVQGNKNDSGKNDRNAPSFIKKVYQNNQNKDNNKQVQRTAEDGDIIIDILKKEYVDRNIIQLIDAVDKKESKLKKINERKNLYKVLAMSLSALLAFKVIYDIRQQYKSIATNPNSVINKFKNKLATKQTKL